MLRSLSLSVVSLLAIASPPGPIESRPAIRVSDPKAEDSATAIVDVTVIPMDRERTLPGQTVLVEHGKVTALGPVGKVRIPANARRVDGRGKFLIPGLSDMHLHLQAADSAAVPQWLLLLVANGVTTARSVDYEPPGTGLAMGGIDMLRLRARVAAGKVLGPRIYTSGWWGDSASFRVLLRVENPKDPTAEVVEQKIAAYKARGYDFIKVHDESPAVYRMLVAAARKVGIPIAGHVPREVLLAEALTARQRSIEHLTGYGPTIRRHSADGPRVIAATRAAHVWNCPTLHILEGNALYVSTDTLEWPEVKRYFSEKDYRRWKEEMRERAAAADTATIRRFDSTKVSREAAIYGDMPGFDGSLPATRQFIKALQDSGAGLLTGTDHMFAEGPSYLGFALHRELQAFVRAGLTPYQTLAASTRNAAEYFGTLKETGTVAVGKRADLVLLNGNPLTDIKNTMLPAGVVVAGRWLSRAELDERLAAEWHPELP